ncbi:LysR family transcriptional regulator [Ideonella livida]|uniref:LysR family transcriptional regulator n=1 Tax=Ideonella livida TaxID=2707176 RepID=A0A7C9TKC9_9BURK|nr:LysR family transcriptional regulator [Ideonella livida]NDY91225.1 LysR family transcriptional regulator [Ideonella livida]
MTTNALPELKLLQLFDVLYDTRSVTRAAEALGQSQPTVSIWLGRLREQLHDPLFVRTPAGMTPTPQAEAMIGPCREVLEGLRRLAAWETGFDPATARRRLRICMTDASHITLLPRLLAAVRRQAPGVRLEAARIDGNTERALESGEADLAIGYVPWLGGGIYQQQLFTQDWVCLSCAGHPRVQGGEGQDVARDVALDVARYQAEAHVVVAAGTGAQLLEQALLRSRIERQVALELPGFLGLGAIVQSTELLATLPRHIGSVLAATHGLTLQDCPFPVEGFAVRQHWHPRFHQEPGHRWLRGLVAQLFGLT